jgi:hypothetical protein
MFNINIFFFFVGLKLFTRVVVIVAKLCNNIIMIMKYVGIHNIQTIHIYKYNNYNCVEIQLLCNVSCIIIYLL